MRVSPLLFASAAAALVVESLTGIPQGWSLAREAKPNDLVALKISLHQQHGDKLEQVVLDVSTPGHSMYGKHLSRDELRGFTAPTTEAVDAVTSWLSQYGIRSTVDNDWVSLTTTVGRADTMLDTKFGWYKYEKADAPVLRSLSYSVPDDLLNHVDLIQPTTRFGQLGTHRSTIFDVQRVDKNEGNAAKLDTINAVDEQGAAAVDGITPDILKKLYNITYVPKYPERSLVGFASYLEEYARYSDLAAFTKNYAPGAVGQNFSVVQINDGLNDQQSDSDSGEANLDLQYVLGISHPIPVVEYSTGGRGYPTAPGSNEPYLEFLTHLLAMDDDELPQTLSTSYGEEEQSIPEEYARKICNMLMQLGGRGVTVIFSSGDTGPGNTCVRVKDNKPYFQPTFPAGCPYVTSVGATYQTGPEKAITFSSGGFSSLHPRPAWQDEMVSRYLKRLGNHSYLKFFNASNRGIPDVAAQGSNFLVYDKGYLSRLSGTSASAPVFAGIVALLNAMRLDNNMKPFGFINPWLYANWIGFEDITSGHSVGCYNATYFENTASWNATTGWDPVTGLGTPSFAALRDFIIPPPYFNPTQ